MGRLSEDFKEFTKNGGIAKKLVTIFFNPNFKAVKNFRLANFFYRHHLELFAKLLWYRNRVKYAIDIDYRADLAGGGTLSAWNWYCYW
jgi:serine O-acetyltransferase